MADKFHINDLENPLYEYSQVLTMPELVLIYKSLADQYYKTKWWQFRLRYGLVIIRHVLYAIIVWLQEGKPTSYGSGNIS